MSLGLLALTTVHSREPSTLFRFYFQSLTPLIESRPVCETIMSKQSETLSVRKWCLDIPAIRCRARDIP